jgi:two-component sensor histidine kinase/ActR/RegA family two-component response regulator
MVSCCNSVVAVKKEQRSKATAVVPPAAERDLAGALHEVSNALTVVLGWLDNARASLDGPGREAIDVARAHAALGHAIARRAVGAPVTDSTDLRSALTLARETVHGVSPIAGRRRVRILIEDDAADVLLPDPTIVQQILINLLLNAIAFTPPGENIRLTLRNDRSRFVFRVRDDGPGIPADQRDKLFCVGPSRRPGGAGIGLAHSYDLAESRGGGLALLDGGAGACFELRWPVGDAPSTTLAKSSVPKLLEGLRVAVLEDDAAVMSLIELGLGKRGVELYPLSSRSDLEAFARSGTPIDAALIDLSPIAHDPDGAIGALRRAAPNASVFLISGTTITTTAHQHIAGWIRKPFELGEIVQALGRLCGPGKGLASKSGASKSHE